MKIVYLLSDGWMVGWLDGWLVGWYRNFRVHSGTKWTQDPSYARTSLRSARKNDQMIKYPDGKTAQLVHIAKWPNDQMAQMIKWPNCQIGQMTKYAKWRNGPNRQPP